MDVVTIPHCYTVKRRSHPPWQTLDGGEGLPHVVTTPMAATLHHLRREVLVDAPLHASLLSCAGRHRQVQLWLDPAAGYFPTAVEGARERRVINVKLRKIFQLKIMEILVLDPFFVLLTESKDKLFLFASNSGHLYDHYTRVLLPHNHLERSSYHRKTLLSHYLD